ncbi:MAG TPA: hypothetical protein VJM32_05355 [Candidatus Saccharimonadales bacterium]|nr:hypothetical protein [Candidatus Saccharimonadales bacterium]
MDDGKTPQEHVSAMIDDSHRLFMRNLILLLCSKSLASALFILLLLPGVLSMHALAWVILVASAADVAACVRMLRWRKAYRLLSFKHYSTELARGRLHRGSLWVQLAAMATIALTAIAA